MAKIHLAMLLGVLFALAFVAAPLQADYDKSQSSLTTPKELTELDKLIQQDIPAILSARTEIEWGIAFRALLNRATPDVLRQLKNHANHGIALQVAWQEVIASVLAKKQQDGAAPDAERLQRFVGFVEGRLQWPLPDWWVQTLLDGKVTIRPASPIRTRIQFDPAKHHKTFDAGEGFDGPKGVVIGKAGGDTTVRMQDQSLTLPKTLLEGQSDHLAIHVIFEKSDCYIAVPARRPFPFGVHRLDRASGELLWTAAAWAQGTMVYRGPREAYYQAVQLVKEGDAIVVYGSSVNCAYIEAFSANNGAALFRFRTFLND